MDTFPFATDWANSSQDSAPASVLDSANLKRAWDQFTAFPGDTFLSVVSASGRGFPGPMANVLRVELDRNMSNSQMLQVDSAWTRPAVGEYLFIRSYDRLDMPVGESTNTHVMHIGSSTDGYGMRLFEANVAVGSDSTLRVDYDFMFNQNNLGRGVGRFRDTLSNTDLNAYTTVRREMRFHRFHTDSLRAQIRIYDSAGGLLLTGSDFVCFASGTGGCNDIGGYQNDTIGQYAFNVDDWAKFENMEVGNNGAEAGDPASPAYWYWGGIAVRVSATSTDWIGPYPSILFPESN